MDNEAKTSRHAIQKEASSNMPLVDLNIGQACRIAIFRHTFCFKYFMKYRHNLREIYYDLSDSAGRDLNSASTTTFKPVLKMRRRPTLHDKKLKASLKSRDSALRDVNIGTTSRNRPKIVYSRLSTCRSRSKGHMIQFQTKRSRLPDQMASMAKGMAELHLPFLAHGESHSLSTAEWAATTHFVRMTSNSVNDSESSID